MTLGTVSCRRRFSPRLWPKVFYQTGAKKCIFCTEPAAAGGADIKRKSCMMRKSSAWCPSIVPAAIWLFRSRRKSAGLFSLNSNKKDVRGHEKTS